MPSPVPLVLVLVLVLLLFLFPVVTSVTCAPGPAFLHNYA
jgi:hypothetical protein